MPDLQEGLGALTRLRSMMAVPAEPTGGRAVPAGPVGLTVRNLRFSYPHGSFTLHDVDLEVPPGTTLALVGRTGSGKSTLASLLSRAVEPPAGTVFVGDVDVTTIDLQQLRGSVGVVTQRTELLAGTLADNVTLFADIPRDTVARAVEELGLTSWVAGLPDGLDTAARPGRHRPVRRRGAAGRVRAAAGARRAGRRPRRGDGTDGPGDGGAGRRRGRAPAQRPHRRAHRTPAVDDRPCRHGGRAGRRAHRAAGRAQRTRRRAGPVPRPARRRRSARRRGRRRGRGRRRALRHRGGPADRGATTRGGAGPRSRARAQHGVDAAHPPVVGARRRRAVPGVGGDRRVGCRHRLALGPPGGGPARRSQRDGADAGGRGGAARRAGCAGDGVPHLPAVVVGGDAAGAPRGAARADDAAPAAAYPARRGRRAGDGRRPVRPVRRPVGRLPERPRHRRGHRCRRVERARRRRTRRGHGGLRAGVDAGYADRGPVRRRVVRRTSAVRPVAGVRPGRRPHRQARRGDARGAPAPAARRLRPGQRCRPRAPGAGGARRCADRDGAVRRRRRLAGLLRRRVGPRHRAAGDDGGQRVRLVRSGGRRGHHRGAGSAGVEGRDRAARRRCGPDGTCRPGVDLVHGFAPAPPLPPRTPCATCRSPA